MSDRSLTLETRREETGHSTVQPGLARLFGLLASRTLLFISFQLLITLGLFLFGQATPFDEAARWWPFAVTMTNLTSVTLLILLLRREGSSLWVLYAPDRDHWLRDLGIAVLLSGVGGVLAIIPMILIANWLFGDPAVPAAMMYRALPLGWAIAAMTFFPITQGLAELPTYAGYIMPRLKRFTGTWWLAVLLAGFWLGAQHIAVPLLLDGRYLIWRFLMFMPFAIYTCGVLAWKPRLLPFFMVVHVLMDVQAASMLLP